MATSKSKHGTDIANLFFETDINLATRTIYLGGENEIDADSVSIYIKGLHLLNASSTDAPITIILNNSGGDVVQGLALIDYMKQLTNPIHAHVYGQCYSMAVAILQAADERYLAKHSSLLIHDGQANIEGYNKNTLKNWAKFTEQLDRWYDEILLKRIQEKHPSFTMKKLHSMMIHDTLLTASESIELGLADSLIEEVASA